MAAGTRSNAERMISNVNMTPTAENETEEFCLYVAPVTLCQELQSVVSVNGSPIKFLVDTGAAVSIVCVNQVSPCLGKLQPSSLMLKTYNESDIEVLGILKCKLEFQGRTCWCDLVVVPRGRAILGRNALAGPGININCLRSTCEVNEVAVGDIKRKFREVFSEKLGKVKGFVHHVKLKRAVKWVQHKVRRLPLGIKETVREEIEGLIERGVIGPVGAS